MSTNPITDDRVADLRGDAHEARQLSMAPGLNAKQVAALEEFANGIEHALRALGHQP